MNVLTPRTYYKFAQDFLKKATLVSVDGVVTKELVNAKFIIKNPIDRLITSPTRKVNFPFAVAEWLSMITREDRVTFFTTFIKDYGRYSLDKEHIAGAYGPRVTPQIDPIIWELQRDPNSRRAVISIFNGEVDHGPPIVPCTLSLQFLIRDQKLNLIITMRSNDLFTGVPYDIFQFTMLQEYVARQLGCELGTYFHNAGSLHVYERDFEKITSTKREKRWPMTMSPMPSDGEAIRHDAMILKVIYQHLPSWDLSTIDILKTQYFKNLAWAAIAWLNRHDERMFQYAYQHVTDQTIKKVLRNWV